MFFYQVIKIWGIRQDNKEVTHFVSNSRAETQLVMYNSHYGY